MSFASLKRGRRRGRSGDSGHGMPALVPMIDMLVILVVYMLVHTADYEILPNTKNISIPQSDSEARPHETTVMMVTRDTVYVDGQVVATVAALEAGDAPALAALKLALTTETQKVFELRPDDPTAREVTVMADRTLQYSLLKKIMMAATAADVTKMSLAVIEKERAVSAPNRG
jgi:biopolymer transport protein ExbD